MAKLTLSDIASGYQSATSYNANNALIEAALENTLSRDGTTPNQMAAALDMNSNDINNVDDVNADGVVCNTLTLNGTVISTTTTLTGGLDAGEVSFTPTNPAGAATTLQDALDDDYLRNDRDETLTGTLTVTEVVSVGDDILLTEQADHVSTAAAGFGILWLSNDTEQKLKFTRDDATDLNLSFPAQQTDHKRAGKFQIIDGETAGAAAFDVESSLVITTWESVGPTGSGADNIWAALDNLPADARMLIVNYEVSATTSGASNAQVHLWWAAGDVTTPVTQNHNASMLTSDHNASGNLHSETRQLIIPLDSNHMFQLRYQNASTSSATLNLFYQGFITD